MIRFFFSTDNFGRLQGETDMAYANTEWKYTKIVFTITI